MTTVATETPPAGPFAGDEEAAPPASRMVVAVLALAGLFLATWLTMYKLGIVGSIQCTVGGCEKVQGSAYAYFLGLPVAAYGVGGYGAIFVAALLGIQPRWAASRGIALAIFGMAAVGVAFTLYLTYLEALVIHAWCQWCLVSAAIITLIFLFSLPGLRRAR